MTRFMMMTKTAARIYEQFISSDKCSCHRDFHANANVLPLIESVLAGRLRCMNEEYAISIGTKYTAKETQCTTDVRIGYSRVLRCMKYIMLNVNA